MLRCLQYRRVATGARTAIPSNRRDLKLVDLGLGLAPVRGEWAPLAAGVKAGRRPPGGLGLDPGEDGARLSGSRSEPVHAACSGPASARVRSARSCSIGEAMPSAECCRSRL